MEINEYYIITKPIKPQPIKDFIALFKMLYNE